MAPFRSAVVAMVVLLSALFVIAPSARADGRVFIIRPAETPGRYNVVFFDDRGRELLIDVIGG